MKLNVLSISDELYILSQEQIPNCPSNQTNENKNNKSQEEKGRKKKQENHNLTFLFV